ncbi:MAG: MBL fold metallo-hydrolase [Planctomycetaceae bacterium]|jgi:phosphoribosyl 1,2-cyclic phosphodiesterase|nr:MBL fold metallo-hydrolase [Planctomycetaceae bacterium]
MKLISLQSGSNGNCTFVESCGIRLLFDAGLSGDATAMRLGKFGIDICSINGVLISHDHVDHVKSAGVLHRKFQLPVWMTHKTFEQASQQHKLGRFEELNFFKSGERIIFGKIAVETKLTLHDAADGVCFVVDDGLRRLGVMTDLGRTKSITAAKQNNNFNQNNEIVDNKIASDDSKRQRFFEGFEERQNTIFTENYYEQIISTLDGLLIESNFDIGMLANGTYSAPLQERIRGQGGHLSNWETANLIKTAGKKLRWACLGHISKENNTHDLVLDTYREIVGSKIPPAIASRYEVSEVLEL